MARSAGRVFGNVGLSFRKTRGTTRRFGTGSPHIRLDQPTFIARAIARVCGGHFEFLMPARSASTRSGTESLANFRRIRSLTEDNKVTSVIFLDLRGGPEHG